ncbi:Floral homeotic protein DEFICIENS, putative [Ricinus communis]|uniref:Floral homeotic protein DEFICIENS, putative n=2 Tax=Ricinus communis TaxID=3988 RepID=B9R829_RICCO|nr:Floral homeotic protein DEFICIENS, putative [Ricinus communis]
MTLGVDIWISQYEKMQDHLKKLKDVNRNLRTEIGQRMGECLSDLSFEDLRGLEQQMDNAIKVIRERKNKVVSNQIEKFNRKLRNLEKIQKNLLDEFEARVEDPHYGLVDNGVDYDSVIAFQNGGPHRPNHIPGGAGSDLTTYPLLEKHLRSCI